ncbi:Uncharacterized conserved protein, tellurite resistance protein B (TerB) family [Amycolatopsis xylanica]|uniref:Uncharacterized conserved protein, tellurite resistance protein B (TerB) family n=1 Tax=Amycolatopsis xylanica TaxID=589385 RepID=A0A1H2SGL4_9PSEU|nr:TerB N-terminal domain-containing protein [Amycolatopsis xylanica]SDW30760.1 Uncharacterized conserved protein, tellurite resistance protein B (TerB) family [Amycolatopsis xylanica]
MSLLDRFRNVVNSVPRGPARSGPVWVPPGGSVQVGGLTLPQGMIYVGSVPREFFHSSEGGEIIDPALPVDWSRPDTAGAGMEYWPAYHEMSPGSRAAYLQWLAGGRRAPDTHIGYVFLFFYGLERRVMVDAARDPHVRGEFGLIRREVDELLRLYGMSYSFRSQAGSFAGVLDLLLGEGRRISADPPPDAVPGDRFEPPFWLRAGIGEFARDGLPVSQEWAFAWAMAHPTIYPRTPAGRCANEFRRLFMARYRAKHGAGMVVRPARQKVVVTYSPASAALGTAQFPTAFPDVLTAEAPTHALSDLMDECADALDSYSRLLGRSPEAGHSLAAAALLPVELFDASAPALGPLTAFVAEHLRQGAPQAVVDAGALTDLWQPRRSDKFAKADAVALAQVLDRLGVGIEPDVRLGGAARTTGPMVLFRAEAGQPAAPSAEYQAATTLVHLAAVVSAADDDVSEAEREHLMGHLESSLHLSSAERLRLTAHLSWLLAGDLKLTGLTKRLSALSGAQRADIGEFLIGVAGIDGRISPAEVTMLRKIFKLIELDPESVYGKLHAVASGGAPATEPVTVVAADTSPTGYLIPKEHGPRADAAEIELDQGVIEAKLAESAAVSALLAEIFNDEPDPVPPAKTETWQVELVGELDADHSTLLRELATRPRWTRAEFDKLCGRAHLLPEGALDTLNEAAMAMAEEPVIEGDDDLRMNDYALGELLA